MRKAVTVVLGALSLMPAVDRAQTQTQSSEATGALEEIVVSAQRRIEPLQEVPISITAFTSADLYQSNVTQSRDYLMMTPNVSFADDGQTGTRSIRIAIRGVSNISLGDNAVPNAIGYYIDEFNVGNVANGTINPTMLDVQRVEVLRGPQGTYFGRNSTGGAINISTNLPDSKWFGEAAVNGGTFDTYGGHAIVNAPVTDTFFLRGAVSYESSTGTVQNLSSTGTRNSGYDQTDVRLSARWLITDKFTADLSYTYDRDTEGLDADVNTGVLELDTISIVGPGFRPISDGVGFYPQNQGYVDHNRYEWNRNRLDSWNLRLNYDFGAATLRSITGYIKTTQSRMFDEDGVSVDAFYRHNEWQASSWGEELRLQSNPGTAWDWVVGALYARDESNQFSNVAIGTQFSYTYPDTGQTVDIVPPLPNLPINQLTSSYADDSRAIYAEATWRATSQWAFTLGGRYTDDYIDTSQTGIINFGSPAGNLYGNSSFNDFSPRFVVTYKFTPDIMAYGTVSHGFKAGGNNLSVQLANHNQPFAPEKVWNYELGFKSEFWEHRAMLNMSAFYLDWHDLQAEVDYLAIPGDISSAVEITETAASATSKGLEAETRLRPIDHLTFDIALGYLQASFGDFPNAVIYGESVNMTGVTLPQSPKWTGSALVEWSAPIDDRTSWYVRYLESYRGESTSNLEGAGYQRLGLPSFPFLMPSWWVANLNFGVTSGGVTVDLSVQNLWDKEYYTGTGDHFGLGGVRVTPHPRMVLLEAIYRTH